MPSLQLTLARASSRRSAGGGDGVAIGHVKYNNKARSHSIELTVASGADISLLAAACMMEALNRNEIEYYRAAYGLQGLDSLTRGR